MNPIDSLRKQLWTKAFGEVQPKAEKWMGQSISQKIEEALGDRIEEKRLKVPHPDTIVNFLNENNAPKKKTLDLLSWYVIGDAQQFRSYQDFLNARQHNNSTPVQEPESLTELPQIALSNAEQKRRIILAGVLTGLVSALFISGFTFLSGYVEMEDSVYRKMLPMILLYQLLLGFFLASLMVKLIQRFRSENNPRKRRWAVVFFVAKIFVITTFVGQQLTRDSYLMAWDQGVGWLGHPNFEMIANALALSMGTLMIASYLANNPVPGPRDRILFFFRPLLVTIIAYSLVYFVF
ncbi:MAG: hypothetical protein AAFO94_19775, partial [Bacteroidota bacterium]